jgi:hypothetical protein
MDSRAVDTEIPRLYELAAAFEASRAADVPTYAPKSFSKAQRLLADLRQRWADYQKKGALEEKIALVSRELEAAGARARATEPHLSRLVQKRRQAIMSGTVGYHAPQELKEAEKLFRATVEEAEDQASSLTKEAAVACENAYLEATLRSLERGPIQRLAFNVEHAGEVVPSDVLEQAQAALLELTDTVQAARNGEVTTTALRRKIASRGSRLGQLLGPFGNEALDPDLVDLPDNPWGEWAPGTRGRPEAPTTMHVTERTSDALTVVWMNRTNVYDSSLLERSSSDGPWQVVAEFPPAAAGWVTYDDQGLPPDTFHRYRVRVQNEFGSNVTTPDDTAVGYTRTEEDLPVRRLQFYVRVADVPDAGTNDSVQLRLQSPLVTYAPNGNNTWLDHAPRPTGGSLALWEDDLQRGSEFVYDVRSTYISQLSDITMLTVRKEGTDALGIAELALIVNGRDVFRRNFGETASTCLWIDEGDGHSPIFTIYHPELRAANEWQSYVQAPPDLPSEIPNDEVVSRFEGITGDALHGTDARWRPALRPVRATRVSDEEVHVTLMLRGDASILPDPDVTLGFDLRLFITCNDDNTEATLKVESGDVQASAEFALIVELLALAAAPAGVALLLFAMHLATEVAKESWEPIVEHMVLDPPIPGFCPKVQINQEANGDAIITFRPV